MSSSRYSERTCEVVFCVLAYVPASGAGVPIVLLKRGKVSFTEHHVDPLPNIHRLRHGGEEATLRPDKPQQLDQEVSKRIVQVLEAIVPHERIERALLERE